MRLRMSDILPIRRALLSVSDKTGLVEFGRFLAERGVEILSTGGTAKALRDAGVPVKDVSEHTGFPEILDGRVKTLLPQVHGGLLGRRDLAEHLAQMDQHGIAPIDLVAVNLYPFEATVAKGAGFDDCIENIDIGGPAMIRSAAKNHADVAVLTEPDALRPGAGRDRGSTAARRWRLRRRLAAAAFARTAAYDAAISALVRAAGGPGLPATPQPSPACCGRRLRYGENPHQQAAFYIDGSERPGHCHGDAGAGQGALLQQPQRHRRGLRMRRGVRPARHRHRQARQPLRRGGGARPGRRPGTAALLCDPVSAFGGIVAANRVLDAAAAEKITAIFTEVVIAPDADEAAKAIFARKKNLRLLLTGGMPDPGAPGLTFKSVSGGFLAQSRDAGRVDRAGRSRW